MALEFDLDQVAVDQTDFYVAEGRGRTPRISLVLIDKSVREALVDAAKSTWAVMRVQRDNSDPEPYDPSNDYPSTSHLQIPLDDELAAKARYLHGVENPEELDSPNEILPRISLYIARLYDKAGRKLTAVKNTSGFGRPLGRGKLASLTNGELHLVREPQFQLATDFDFLIDRESVHVYRHMSFESACNVQDAIREALKLNVEYLSEQIPFVDFGSLDEKVMCSIRAAREIAAIRAHGYDQGLSRDRLVRYCEDHRIGYSETNGKLVVDAVDQSRFIRLLARKILEIQLRDDSREVFEVSSRKPLRT